MRGAADKSSDLRPWGDWLRAAGVARWRFLGKAKPKSHFFGGEEGGLGGGETFSEWFLDGFLVLFTVLSSSFRTKQVLLWR